MNNFHHQKRRKTRGIGEDTGGTFHGRINIAVPVQMDTNRGTRFMYEEFYEY